VHAVAMTPDGSRLAIGCEDGAIRLWEVESGRLIGVFQGHGAAVANVVISSDGATLFSAAGDLRIWDASSGRCTRVIRTPGDVRSLAVLEDGSEAASATGSTISLWDLRNGQLREPPETQRDPHLDSVRCLQLVEGGDLMLSGSADHTMRAWSFPSGRLLRTFTGHAKEITTIAAQASGGTVASGSRWESGIRLWNSDTGAIRTVLQGHEERVEALALSADGAVLISDATYDQVRVWDTESGQLLLALDKGHTHSSSVLALSPDGARLVTSGRRGTLLVWDLASGRLVRRFRSRESIYALSLLPDGVIAISGGNEGVIDWWDLESGRRIRRLTAEADISCLMPTRDGQRLLSGEWNGVLRIWDVASGECVHRIEAHPWVRQICVSPNDRVAVTIGHDDHAVRVWDVEQGKLVATYISDSLPLCLSALNMQGQFGIGLASGDVRVLRIRPWHTGVSTVTPVRLFRLRRAGVPGYRRATGEYADQLTFRCAHCGRIANVGPEVEPATEAANKGGAVGRSPCMTLDRRWWADVRLRSHCSHCQQPVIFTPFAIDGAPRNAAVANLAPNVRRNRLAVLRRLHDSWPPVGDLMPALERVLTAIRDVDPDFRSRMAGYANLNGAVELFQLASTFDFHAAKLERDDLIARLGRRLCSTVEPGASKDFESRPATVDRADAAAKPPGHSDAKPRDPGAIRVEVAAPSGRHTELVARILQGMHKSDLPPDAQEKLAQVTARQQMEHLQELIAISRRFRDGAVSPLEFHRHLISLLDTYSDIGEFPNLDRYLIYLELAEDLKGDALVAESSALMSAVLGHHWRPRLLR
jgi:WD40 repeat protein